MQFVPAKCWVRRRPGAVRRRKAYISMTRQPSDPTNPMDAPGATAPAAAPGHSGIRRFRCRFRQYLGLGLLGLGWLGQVVSSRAHQLPISYLSVVVNDDYVHLDLNFNPFEMADFSAVDTNRNGRLDPAEVAVHGGKIARQLLEHLTLSVDGKPVAAETSGIFPELDGHHATLRAHYRVLAREATITLQSKLSEILGSSHLTQVKFINHGTPQLRQLDARSKQATFKPGNGKPSGPPPLKQAATHRPQQP